uniref:DUF6598 domain-containing protein n=1 Tax=Leersia perrieri TaxID=77586 RepID=A0A0D9Y0P7_9ORYZ
MEATGSTGGESAATPFPGRGKKRPPSPETPPSDGEESDSDDSWAVSDSGGSDDEEEYCEGDDQGMCHPFTVDDFPRFSSDHFVQTHELYQYPDIRLRGPSPLSIFRVYNDPVSVREGKHWFAKEYRLDNESETSVNNVVTVDCSNKCRCIPMSLLQFFDLKISGYRHGIGRLSLTSPARGIVVSSQALLEFKLCVLTECPPEDEPNFETLIEGCTEIYMYDSESFVKSGRFYGEKCGLDVKYAVLINAVQATVDTKILCAPICGLNLKLFAKTSGFSDVICLFRGVAGQGHRLSSVVAVSRHSYLDLCIEGSSIDNALSQKLSRARWNCRFNACYHGTVDEEVKLDDFTTISVKITFKPVGMGQSLK